MKKKLKERIKTIQELKEALPPGQEYLVESLEREFEEYEIQSDNLAHLADRVKELVPYSESEGIQNQLASDLLTESTAQIFFLAAVAAAGMSFQRDGEPWCVSVGAGHPAVQITWDANGQPAALMMTGQELEERSSESILWFNTVRIGPTGRTLEFLNE